MTKGIRLENVGNKEAFMMEAKVFSVCVTYNPDLGLLGRQIESLNNQVHCIVIVDNGSTAIDELRDFFEKERKRLSSTVEFILEFNRTNKGLSYAQNVGIKSAIANSASDILLLDQDSVLEEGFVSALFEGRKKLQSKNVSVGAVGPRYYNPETKVMFPVTRFFGPFLKRVKTTKEPEMASFLIASGCFITVGVLNDVGLMNESLFIDCIDADWSFRAQAKGYKLFVVPSAFMMHTVGEKRLNMGGASMAMHSPLRRYYLFRNTIFLLRSKNVPLGYKIRELVLNVVRFTIYFSMSTDRMKYLKYGFRAMLDGLKGIGGECKVRF